MARSLTRDEGMARMRDAFARYRRARAEDPFGGREYLEEMQGIVDLVDETFELKIPQHDGIPYTIKFLPKRLRAVDPSISKIPLIGAGIHTPPPSSIEGLVL